MSGREFFIGRYAKLGWKYKDVKPRQAVRINSMNVSEKKVVKRLESLGVELERIPFLKNGYWFNRSEFSVGATTEYPFRVLLHSRGCGSNPSDAVYRVKG
ncbi:hypothetical protein CW693_04285 [Candidatus Bathyarchaeota archaeon]|nr:MAG: hypothetical protein CW693_04285 [Candidatus Bathyarchaeota archaeon]